MNKNLFSLPDFTNNDSVLKELIALRRILHRTPETGFHEWKTMELLIDLIKDTQGTITFMPQETAQHLCTLIPKADKPHKFLGTDVSVTGFKLTFNLDPQNKKVKKHLAIRSDIDGLSIPESSDPMHLPAKLGFNAINGAMHACGHDGHMAIALMSALWVNTNLSLLYESDLSAISFIFQPAEEGCRGALAVIDSGFLQDIDLIYCYHLGLGVPSGYIVPCPSDFLASCKFTLEVFGKKSHAGHPELGINALKVTASFIEKALSLLDLKKGLYVNISNLHCEGACNVIPDHCFLEGEIRVLDEENLDLLYSQIEQIIANESKAVPGSYYQLLKKGVGLGIKQDEKLCKKVAEAALKLKLNIMPEFKFNASEDASQLIRHLQKQGKLGCYFMIGSDIANSHHNSSFDFDEKSLINGFNVIKELILSELP